MGKISKNELNDSLKLEIENARTEIVNDFSGGVDKVASAELAKTLNANQQTTNTQLAELTNPNLLINGDFQVWQRGTSFNIPVTNGLYTADRWSVLNQKAGVTVSKSDAGISVNVPSGTGVCFLQYKLEVPRMLLGKRVTVSFKYKTNVNKTENLLVIFNGNGISNLLATISSKAIIANTWQTYTLTLDVPTAVVDNVLTILVGRSEDISEEFEINYFKLELGSIATPLSPKNYAEELASCKRYFEKSDLIMTFAAFSNMIQGCNFTVDKRIAPTISIFNGEVAGQVSNISGGPLSVSPSVIGVRGFRQLDTTGAIKSDAYFYNWKADAEIY